MNSHSVYSQVLEILASAFRISTVRSSYPHGVLFDTLDTNLKIHVHKVHGTVSVQLAFQQRRGVWHALGNFCDELVYHETCAKLGVTQVYASEDEEVAYAQHLVSVAANFADDGRALETDDCKNAVVKCGSGVRNVKLTRAVLPYGTRYNVYADRVYAGIVYADRGSDEATYFVPNGELTPARSEKAAFAALCRQL